MNPIGKAFLKAEVIIEGIWLAAATYGIIIHFTYDESAIFLSMISFFFLGASQMLSGFIQMLTSRSAWFITYVLAVIAYWFLFSITLNIGFRPDEYPIIYYGINVGLPYAFAMVFFLKNLDAIDSFREEDSRIGEFI